MMKMSGNYNPNMMIYQNFFQNNSNLMNQFNNPLNPQNIILNGGVMPRSVNNLNNQSGNDPFPYYIGPRLNLLFETGAGLKLNFPTPINLKVKDLLLKFINKVNVSPTLMGEKIFFIVNGKTIPVNESSTCEDFFRNCNYGNTNQIKIIVIDASNVIGAFS